MLILSVYNEVKTKCIYNQVYNYGFSEENHPAFNLRLILIGVWEVATISVNPIWDLQGQLQLALNLPDTPQRPMSVGEEDITDTCRKNTIVTTVVRAKRNTWGSLIWSSKSQKTKTYIRETSECHQEDELSLCPRHKKDIHGGVGLT